MDFESLGLSPQLLRAVAEEGYDTPTPVQAGAIPPILAGRDVLASARTGTGKTAGFTLPILELLGSEPAPRDRRPRALVLVPTRELAAQVQASVAAYGRHTRLTSTAIFGGVGIEPQIALLRRGVPILIATPGRLIDHQQRGTVDLSGIEILVLDEADRMLDMGFRPAIERIVRALPRQRQTLMFSATFSAEITELAQRYLDRPIRVETAPPNATVEQTLQRAIFVDQSRKRALLSQLIDERDWRQVLVFTRTKHGANRLAKQLVTDGYTAAAIHGNKSQNARTRALEDFKQQRIRILVATDIAARGLDIDQLPQVVNYELPNVPEDYVHRIGRTGRAGREGLAVSLVSAGEMEFFEDIRRLVKVEIRTTVIPGFEPRETAESAPATGFGRGPQQAGRPRGPRPASPAGNSRSRRGGAPQPAATGRGRRSAPAADARVPQPMPAEGSTQPALSGRPRRRRRSSPPRAFA